jgi:soluble lytic murein transglycosylase-like protein
MYLDLMRSIFRTRRGRLPAASAVSLVTIGLLVGTLYAGAPADPADGSAAQAVAVVQQQGPTHLEELEVRFDELRSGWNELDEYYRTRVAPIERVLHRYGADDVLAERIAVALVREANRAGLEPRLLLAVLLVENPWLDPTIRSPVGAIGLMQVMPLHRGQWPGCEPDLEDIDANICHGARIFASYFNATGGNVERALLRYNGCVRGTNTPNCHQYPYHVFARAGRASVLAWLDTAPLAASR